MNLKINSLSTEFLRDISFELKGESAVIIGSNGAGKTTLARAIVGLLPNGNVLCDDTPVGSLEGAKRAEMLNFVPSKLEVFDEYIDVDEFLELCLFNGATAQNIDDTLSKLGILHLKNSPCKNISSGESQLVLFAGGLLHGAELTVFDEPTANLASDKKIKVYEMLKADKKQKLIITHDLNLAYKLGYRVIFLRDGELVFNGSSREFFDEGNLKALFGDSIKKVGDYFTVNY